jgi:hypothetical protein
VGPLYVRPADAGRRKGVTLDTLALLLAVAFAARELRLLLRELRRHR